MTENLILLLCLHFQTPDLNKYYNSCVYTLRAASIQYTIGNAESKKSIKNHLDGFKDNIEQGIGREIERRTNNITRGIFAVGYGFFQRGSVLFNSGFKPIADNITVETGTASTHLTLTWTF